MLQGGGGKPHPRLEYRPRVGEGRCCGLGSSSDSSSRLGLWPDWAGMERAQGWYRGWGEAWGIPWDTRGGSIGKTMQCGGKAWGRLPMCSLPHAPHPQDLTVSPQVVFFHTMWEAFPPHLSLFFSCLRLFFLILEGSNDELSKYKLSGKHLERWWIYWASSVSFHC